MATSAELNAYQEGRKLLQCIRDAEISEGKLRDQALRAGTSVCLNIAEAVGRTALADRARVFAIARGNVARRGLLPTSRVRRVVAVLSRHSLVPLTPRAVYALLTSLIRRFG